MTLPKKRTAVLISGNGSNLQALIDSAQEKNYPAKIALVISNQEKAYGLERAKAASIQTEIMSHKDYPDRESYDEAIDRILQNHDIELICLAGFMRLLSASFTQKWFGKMINIHPSLLPAFKGLNTHERALESGTCFTGCSVHFVVPDMDAGPIILQATVPVLQEDTIETLKERVHQAEHQIYPQALKWLASEKLSIKENRVIIADKLIQKETMLHPWPAG